MRCLPLILTAGLVLAAPAGVAQEREGGMEAKPAPANRAWVKLCDTPAKATRDFYGRPGVVGTRTCLTHHEQLDGATGALLVAAGVRQTAGRQTFTILVPPWVQQGPGLRIYIYPGNLWAMVQKKERLPKDQVGRLGMVSLPVAFCSTVGCTAETDATPQLIADLKANGGFLVLAIRNGQPVAFPVSLSGFRAAYDGPPVDSARYLQAREELLRELRERVKQRVPPPPPPRGKGDRPQPPPAPPGKGDQRI